jgi:hypothetical protein
VSEFGPQRSGHLLILTLNGGLFCRRHASTENLSVSTLRREGHAAENAQMLVTLKGKLGIAKEQNTSMYKET